jgi:hypothetical protein
MLKKNNVKKNHYDIGLMFDFVKKKDFIFYQKKN